MSNVFNVSILKDFSFSFWLQSNENYFVARHKIRSIDSSMEHHHHHHHIHGNDFVAGILDKSRKLQGIIVAAVNETTLQVK